MTTTPTDDTNDGLIEAIRGFSTTASELILVIKGDPENPDNPGLLSGLREEKAARVAADARRGRQIRWMAVAVVVAIGFAVWGGLLTFRQSDTTGKLANAIAQIKHDEDAAAAKNCQTTLNSRLGNREVAQVLIDEVGGDFHATPDQIKAVTDRVNAVLDKRQPLPTC